MFENIQQKAIRGTPDFIGTVNGYYVALELKKDAKTKPDPLQTYKLNRIRKVGKGIALVPCPSNWNQIFNALCELDGKMKPNEIKWEKSWLK